MAPDIDRRARQYLFFRLLIVLLGFGLVTFYQVWLESAFSENAFLYLYGLLSLYLVVGVGLLVTQDRWRRRHAIMRWQVLCDFTIQSLLVWGTGGILSLFSPLLFVTLVAATGVISARGAFFLATVATLFLTATTIAYGLGLAPISLRHGDWQFASEKSGFVLSYLLGSVLALYAVSTLGSRFSHGLRRMAGIHSEILENIGEGLIAVDKEGRVVELNCEARSVLGLEGTDGTGSKLTLESMFPGEKHAQLRDAFRQPRRRRLETSIGLRGEKERPVEVKISSVRDDYGETRYRIGLISDLSLQRDMEAAARRIQKLEDLQVMALGIAHEIRNPLASIRGCVQEIGRLAAQTSQAQRYMEIVRKESDRLDGILEDFLHFARPGPMDLVPLDLVRVIEDASILLKRRPEFGARSLWLTFPPERPRIFGDQNRLIQVFLNLGLNSIDATSPEDGKISMTLRRRRFATMEEKSGGRDLVEGVELELKDNGKGIPDGDLKKIFTPFFTTKERGSGLGLCIVNRIVREHMGVLDVASAEGQGTTFRIWFPVLRPSSQAQGNGKSNAGEEYAAMEEESEFYFHA